MRRIPPLAYYLAHSALTLGVLYAALDLRHCDLRVPMYHSVGGDLHFTSMGLKTLAETGWVHTNPRLGLPGTLDLYDFPTVESLLHAVWKVLAALGGPAVALNLLFLGGFFLSGWTSLFVFRHFGASGPLAVSGALLFAFQPLHFWRGTWHVALGFYPHVPLGVMVCLWVCQGRPIFFHEDGPERRTPGRAAAAGLVCAATAGLGIYYAWFLGFFLLVAGLVVWLPRPRPSPPGDATACLLILSATVLAQAVPVVAHYRAHGRAASALVRSPGASQTFGLSVAELMLPTLGHRVPKLRVVESRRSVGGGADPRAPGVAQRAFLNEKYYNALGAIGAAGFGLLCLVALAPDAPWVGRLSPLRYLATSNLAGVLLASGFALLVEIVFPLIRAYNRIAIFHAFFALFAVVLVVERLHPRAGAPALARAGFALALGVGTAIGLLDQIPSVVAPDHRADRAQFAAEGRYVREAEALLKPGAAVFVLPYTEFPEKGFDHFRPYLHSRSLRWSFGASRGSRADLWQRRVAGKPAPELVAALRDAGFSAVHLDRSADRALGRALRAALGAPDVVGGGGDWELYRIEGRAGPSSGSAR